MKFSATILAALAVFSPLVAASPTPGDNNLVVRADDACVTKTMNIAFCENCISTGTGPPSCVSRWYTHFGNSGEGSCNDQSAPFNDACDTYGSIATPFGDGNWKKADGCSENNSQGTYGATVVPADGTSTWACSCVNSKAQYSTNCGSTFACDQTWFCACSQC